MNTNVFRGWSILALGVLFIAAFSGCGGNDDAFDPDMMADTSGGNNGPAPFETSGGEDLPEIPQETLRFVRDEALETVYFDYNSYALRPDALESLRRNADLMRRNAGVIYQIEGHCDERGTQEYNLALGEKRALATREHLMNLGISGDRLITISYGEEDPVNPGHTESAWSENRRCEFNRAM